MGDYERFMLKKRKNLERLRKAKTQLLIYRDGLGKAYIKSKAEKNVILKIKGIIEEIENEVW